MFVVKRTTTSLITNIDVSTQKYEYEELYDALDHIKRLRKEDMARYKTLIAVYPSFFADYNFDETTYHYTIGKCTISCEIIGVLEDAEKEFYMNCQLKNKR